MKILHSAIRVMAIVLYSLACRPLAAQDASAGVTGISRAFNPAISANALFVGVYTDAEHEGEEKEHGEEHGDEHEEGHAHGAGSDTGLRVQEIELQLSAVVDAYFKTDLILAFPQGEGVELEEGFVTTQSLPAGLQLKAGRFYAALGRHNLLHAHQYPFLNAPLANEHMLGDAGLADDGVSLSWLSPLPWFFEITGQVLDGRADRFASPDDEDLLYIGHATNFFDIGDNWTLEIGTSYATGMNAEEERASLTGLQGTVQWRDVGRSGRRVIWQTEYLGANDETSGFYSFVQAQVASRWWLQGRFGRIEEHDEHESRSSAMIGHVPSEFSALRLQYDRRSSAGETSNTLMLQLNITLGSHPAHRY